MAGRSTAGRGAASWGARAGAPVGLVSALGVCLLAFGTDDVPDIVDREQLPVVYLVAALIGIAVGAAFGVLVAMIATRAALTTTGGPHRRRQFGTAAAGGSAAVVTFLLVPAGIGLVLPGALILGAVAATIAWQLLPRLVDLDAEVSVPASPTRELSGRADPAAAVRRPLSTRQKITRLIIVAGLGGVIVSNVVASMTTDEVGTVAGVVVGAVLAVFTWRGFRR